MGVLYTISIDFFKLPKKQYATLFSTGLIIPVVLSLVLFPVLYLFRLPLERSFNFQPAFFWLIPCCLFFNFCFEAFIILMRNQNNIRLFSIVSLLKIVLEIGLSILIIIGIYRNWYSRAIAILISGIVVAAIFFRYTKKNNFLVKRVDYKMLKNEFYFGLSGLLLQTAIFFMNTSDKFFVMSFFGKVEAGYYAVASTFAAIQYIVCASLLQYLQPVLFKKFASMEKWTTIKSLYIKYSLAMLVTFSGVVAFSYIVYLFVLKPNYKAHLNYFYILSISAFVWTLSNLFLQYILFNKNKKIIFRLSGIVIGISIFVNYISSTYFDIRWLSYGQVITNVLVLFIILWFNKKLDYFA